MYNIAICDPDTESSNTLALAIHQLLSKARITHAITRYSSSDTLFKILEKFPEKHNLLFLETELTPYNGIELGLRLRNDKYEGMIVYMSSSGSNVYDAFTVEAFQYLLKPVTSEHLRALFSRLTSKYMKQQSSKYLKLNQGTTYYKIRYSDIRYIDTAERKISIHTNQETLLYPCKLSEIEKRLPKKLFIRCHQSYILQYYAVAMLTQSRAILKTGEEIPISRPYKKEVHQFFSDFSE